MEKTIVNIAPAVAETPRTKRVAAYARVSTDMEEQLTSYEAQMDYYTKYIMARADWKFAGLYSDADAPYGQNAKRP